MPMRIRFKAPPVVTTLQELKKTAKGLEKQLQEIKERISDMIKGEQA
ncbi:MAG TPA: hypothetical protein VEI57_00600 [Nitrospirota bacterium]|nr:hypothetical protein [Nitrospirota bacterium]